MAQANPFDQFDSAQGTVPVSQIKPIIAAPRDPYEADKEARAETSTGLSVAGEARDSRKEKFDYAKNLRDEFRKAPESVNYETVMRQFSSALGAQPTPTGDQALITAYAKMLDPTSVVREAEFNIVQAGDSAIGKQVANLQKQFGMDESGLIRPEVRARVLREMKNLTDNYRQSYDRIRGDYEGLAESYGVSPTAVIGTRVDDPYNSKIEKLWKEKGVADETEGQQLALTAGENFSTEQDKAIAQAVNQALANGADVQGLAAAAQAAGGQISPDDIANFQAAVEARAQGQAVSFNPQKTGKRNPLSQAIGEAAITPEGTAVTSFLNATGVGIPSLIAGEQISGLEQLNPKSAMLGNIAGSMLGTAGLAKGASAALGAVAPELAARVAGGGFAGAVAREALTEGAYGGLYAANTGGDIGESIALGAAGSLGGRAVGAGLQRTTSPTLQRVGNFLNRNDGGTTPPDGGVPPAGPTGGGGGMPDGGAIPPVGMADDTFTPTTTTFRSGGAAGTTDEGIRVTRAQELPVPIELARFQRSRLFEEQQRARDLAKNNEVGGPIRELLKEQQDKLRQNFDAFLDQTGSREWGNRREQGMVVDDALKTLARRMNNKVNALYKRAEKSGELAEPVDMGGLADELNNLRAERTAAPVIKGIADELAVRELATGSLEKGTLKMKRPLTLNEAEELRKKVNRIAKQNDPNDLRVGSELKSLIDGLTENSGGEVYKAARAARKEVGDKFERVSLVKKLVGMKPGTTDRQVALENVVETAVTSGSTSLDDIKALKSVLDDAGPRGQRAWRELQGATLEHIQNKAYRSQTDESGQRVLYPSQLEKVIADLDKGGKLEFVFDKRTAELLRTMGEVSKDLFTAPPGSVNSSNTASAITNGMDTLVTFMLSGAPIPAGKVSSGLMNSLRSRGLRKEVNRLVSTEQN